MPAVDLIRERLQTLDPLVLEISDESHLHKGHAGNTGGGHYAVLVVSGRFEGVSRLNRQKTVKSLLKDLFSGGMIHALGIRAATPDEYFHTAD
ncbi:BolA family transcriptional regulator [Neisseria meningitidis]|nr:BolA family transcriptional regulator [Neisseria meningitidis]